MIAGKTSGPPAASGSDRDEPRALRIADALERVIDAVGRWAAWLTLALVVLVATNVIFRYLFHIGPVSLQELEWHLMSPIALIGMSYCMRHREHVRVDVFYDKYPPPVRNLIDLAAAVSTVVVAVVIIDLSLGFIEQSYSAGEISPDPGGLHYRWLLKSLIPFGFGLLAVQGAAQALRCGFLAATGGGDGK